jgi:glycosyltransferase involved in cell wall biosynthesis
VTEIYIVLSAERILAQERLRFPEWEYPAPDLDVVRSEFSEQRALLADTDFVVCPAARVRRDLEENFAFALSRSVLVPYGVDQKWLKLALSPVAGRVLFVGTAGLRKGIHYLAKAAELLVGKGRKYEFRIAGDVTSKIKQQPECRHLNFTGRIPHELIQAEYAQADVFVLPSLAEGSAEVGYEALAAALPVITTEAAGSVVRDGIEGLIVPERDPAALAAAIESIVGNRDLRAKMSSAARIRARDYTLERYGDRLIAAAEGFKL